MRRQRSLSIKKRSQRILRSPGFIMSWARQSFQNSTAPDSLQRAKREFKAALAENPHNAGAEAKLRRVDMLREKRLKAKQDYRRALILDPQPD